MNQFFTKQTLLIRIAFLLNVSLWGRERDNHKLFNGTAENFNKLTKSTEMGRHVHFKFDLAETAISLLNQRKSQGEGD